MHEDFIVGKALDEYLARIELTFEGEWVTPDPSLPAALRRIGSNHWAAIRPIEVAVVLEAIEEIYLASIRGDLPPPDYEVHSDWAAEANARSSTLHVERISLGSPLHVVLDLPATVYVSTFAAFAYGLAYVLGVPYRAAAVFHRARAGYFESRVASAEAKEAWLEYKREQVARQTSLRLRAVDLVAPGAKDDVEEPIEPEGDGDEAEN